MATSPASPKDYRERAAFCEESAAKAVSPETRDVMLFLAKRWRMLANEEEADDKG
jgi:hypothetical protein